jgi:hypothetical protein
MAQRAVGIVLALFFFLGGIAFMIPEPTREIGIGQIWVVVGLILLVSFLFPGKIREKLRSLRQKVE